MPEMITVDIETPNGMLLEGSQLPDDYTVQEVIDELVDSLELPRTGDSGDNVEYTLFVVNKNLNLSPPQVIGSSGVYNGDTIRLQASQRIYAPPSQLPPTMMAPQQGDEISVVLSVLDLNRHETVNLSATRGVGDLIRQIVQNYDLPARDKLGQLIKYKLQSKALGRFLEEATTLSAAHVPTLDRLTLHREEIAGAQL
jgi:uncharacterized ubiquitin-like protein YukD